jgi:hypothetical protein
VKTANELKNETQILKLLKPAKRLLAPRYASCYKKLLCKVLEENLHIVIQLGNFVA